MGCDIHAYVERFIEGEWILVYPEPCEEYSKFDSRAKISTLKHTRCIVFVVNPGTSRTCWNTNVNKALYFNRNYALFALLADVRNRGYIQPIAEARGVPPDASPAYRLEAEASVDWHSHSWFTVDELIDFYSRNHSRLNVMSLKGVKGVAGYSVPSDYGSYTNPEEGYIVYMDRMLELVSAGYPEEQCPYWGTDAVIPDDGDALDSFWHVTVPELRSIDDDPRNVRLCFFFDN